LRKILPFLSVGYVCYESVKFCTKGKDVRFVNRLFRLAA